MIICGNQSDEEMFHHGIVVKRDWTEMEYQLGWQMKVQSWKDVNCRMSLPTDKLNHWLSKRIAQNLYVENDDERRRTCWVTKSKRHDLELVSGKRWRRYFLVYLLWRIWQPRGRKANEATKSSDLRTLDYAMRSRPIASVVQWTSRVTDFVWLYKAALSMKNEMPPSNLLGRVGTV